MPNKLRLLITISLLFVLQLQAQIQSFRYFGTENGLSNNFINDVHQDKKGFLWISHSDGVYQYDGQIFKNAKTIFKNNDSTNFNGIKLTNEWVVLSTKGGALNFYKPELSNAVKTIQLNVAINKLFLSLDSNYIYAISNGQGVFQINTKTFEKIIFKEALNDLIINDLVAINKTSFFIASADGLFLYNTKSQSLTPIDDNVDASSLSYDADKRTLYTGTKSFGLNAYLLDMQFQVDYVTNCYSSKNPLETSITTLVNHKGTNELYFATAEGSLHTYDKSTKQIKHLLKRNLKVKINNIFFDKTNNVWLSSFGKGLLRSSYDPFEKFFQRHNISSLVKDELDNFYFAEEEFIYAQNFKTNQCDSFSKKNGLPQDKITALHCDKNNTLWVGYQNNGLYFKLKNTTTFLPFIENTDFIDNPINAITSAQNKELYVSTTLEGVLVINNKQITGRYNTKNNLPHNNILFTFIDSKSRIWFATYHSTLSYLEDGKISDFSLKYPNVNFDINGICEDSKENLWFLTRDNGVYLFNDSLRYTVNEENGLPSNFGTSIICDNFNQLWIAQTDLLTKFSLAQNILRTYSTARLLDNMYFNKNACLKDEEGNLWFGTTEGVIKYNYQHQQGYLPEAIPQLQSFKVFDEVKSLNQEQRLQYGTYNLSFQYSALCVTQSEDVLFRYILEGHDKQWSEPTHRLKIDYENLKDGVYTFKVMASNSEGLWNKTPLSYSFIIEKPFWKTFWFWILISLLFILSVTLFNYYRTRLLVKYNKELTQRVNEKTQMLEEEKQTIIQKNKEIESYNKELNSSINYARHIQRSVLPVKTEMSNDYISSFAIYRPKDVISGDFYKVFHVGTKTIIILADSTGHGVPGALLSMMGNSLLNSIIGANDRFNPSEILHQLDKAIIQTLQQKAEDFLNESMDIALVVIDSVTNTLAFAGANRPLYLVRNGELQEFNGNRFPVGGLLTKIEKQFETHRFVLQPKDCMYVFTDGFTDQFDRNNKTKFATKRLKELVVKQAGFNLSSQEFEMNNTLNNWKGMNDQTDDILLIGIQYLGNS
jgi:ligand-binding sensor domain-containing protein/serine phosphatase RsbU (regulator of sigma subunit)